MNASPALLAALAGLGFGLSLIVAIGAQNLFVLRQGLRREHVGVVVTICAASDAILIAAGVGGLGALLDAVPWLGTAMRWGGAAFLVGYGVLAARRALRARGALTADDSAAPATGHLRTAVLTTLAFTWLNPHVYLDTVVLMGSVASGHGGYRWWFAAGAAVASVAWFTALGYGARVLRPVFARPVAWRVLDAIIAVVMLVIAATLIVQGFAPGP
jgi:L-lysine exporter family protein LysE/ArgO